MSIFDQDIQINHEILIENGWEERYLYLSKTEPNYHGYTLKVNVKPQPRTKLKWFSSDVWFIYDPRTQMIEFLESSEIESQKVDTISDINIYINVVLNHFDCIRA